MGVLSVVYVTVAVSVALVMLLGPRLFGWQFATVLTGSMEPHLPVGSVAVTVPVDPANVRVGDVIAFTQEDRTISHRVIKIGGKAGARSFVTKGDANPTPDVDPVSQAAVKGRVVFDIWSGGYIVQAIRSPIGMGTLAGVTVLMLFFAGASKSGKEKSKNGEGAAPAADLGEENGDERHEDGAAELDDFELATAEYVEYQETAEQTGTGWRDDYQPFEPSEPTEFIPLPTVPPPAMMPLPVLPDEVAWPRSQRAAGHRTPRLARHRHPDVSAETSNATAATAPLALPVKGDAGRTEMPWS
jgi:signal peptidase